jgi:hypothetical protein
VEFEKLLRRAALLLGTLEERPQPPTMKRLFLLAYAAAKLGRARAT